MKASLFEKTPRAKPGGLINCVRNFRDTSEVRHLEEWIDCDHDFAAPSALGALAVVAPERAIEFVRSGVRGGTRGFASWWFPWLMLVRRDETLELARERLSSDDAVPEWFSHSEEYLDAATTRAISERLTAQLAEALERPQPEEKRVPFAPAARLLAAAAHVTTVDVLASYADSVFERQLVEMAGRLPFSDGHYLSDEGADIRTILRRVSETGSVAAIVEELMAEHKVAVRAIDWAAAYPVEPIREALRARLSRIAATWNGKEIPYRVIRLIRSLALVGDDGAVVDAISTFSANAVDDDLPWLLGDQPPLSDALVEKLLATATLSSSPDEQCRSLGALRLSRRHDVVPTILAIAARTDVTSAVRWFALTAARDLVKFGAEVADFVGSLVASDPGDERHILADLLIRSGTAASMDLLATLARRLPFTHVSDHAVVERLVDRSPRGKEMAELLASHLPPFPHTTLFNRDAFIWSRLIAALDRADLRQQALDYAGTPVAMVNPLSIIECVATFDGDAAFDFAHAALRGDVEGREVLPPHLLRYNARRAVDSLLRHLPEERSGVVRWHVARTLRWSGDPSIAARAEEMSRERSPEMRAAACDLAGWIPHVVGNHRLRELALADENKDVRTAARDALERQLRLAQSEELRDRLRRSGGSKAWMYAEALVSYADPYLLDRREDPLFIYSALEQKPRALRLMVEQWLEPRRKQVDRDAESEDLVRGRRSV